jgi:hypothetical protein
MNLEGLKSITLNCPLPVADWDKAAWECGKPKIEAMVEIAYAVTVGTLSRADLADVVRADGGTEAALAREDMKSTMYSALAAFVSLYFTEGAKELSFTVDSSKWYDGKDPGHWLKSSDAVVIMLLEYGVLQAAGFSVASEERE